MPEFTEIQEFVEIIPPAPIPQPAPTEWDGWGDEADKRQFEKSRPTALPLGDVAISGTIETGSGHDGWGIDPTLEK